MSCFLCPNCGNPLEKNEHTYICQKGHSFDIAKSGYVNLMLNVGQGRHGDDKAMVHARTDFLNGGYYRPLANAIMEILKQENPKTILDAGCGEGYYTRLFSDCLPEAKVVGLDISKDALAVAAKKCKNCEFAVASTSSMPIQSKTMDCVLTIFSPFFPEEFCRVLRTGGYFIRVIPLEYHLHELRELVYDHPYDNTVPDLGIDGFTLIDNKKVEYSISIDGKENIRNLFTMTPYYYKTGREDQEKLESVSSLTTTVSFGIVVYRKN